LKTFLNGCILLFPDETTAEFYGEIKAQLSAAGTPIPQNDIGLNQSAIGLRHPIGETLRYNDEKG
jgi:predicted nucleic acid-binding protein